MTIQEAHEECQRLYPLQPCEMPGPHLGKLERHHKDGNPRNNERHNIAFLCTSHHRQAHRRPFIPNCETNY